MMDDYHTIFCRICRIPFNESLAEHGNSRRHHCNLLLQQWAAYRKGMVKDRENVEITVQLLKAENATFTVNARKGSYITQIGLEDFIKEKKIITYSFTAKNLRRNAIYLTNVYSLHPTDLFTLIDEENVIQTGNVAKLMPKDEYTLKLKLRLPTPVIGSYKMPIVFKFISYKQVKNDLVPNQLIIAKEMVVIIGKNKPVEEAITPSPFTAHSWNNVFIHKPLNNKKTRFTLDYEIPKYYQVPLITGLSTKDWMNPTQRTLVSTILEALEKTYDSSFENYVVASDGYAYHFHILLWLEEMAVKLSLQMYNMESILLQIFYRNYVQLNVPGLAEKRPSVLVGDTITIKIHDGNEAYQGVVREVLKSTVIIQDLEMKFVDFVRKYPKATYDVKFEMNRISFIRQHEALDIVLQKELISHLFPEPSLDRKALHSTLLRIELQDHQFINPSIATNPQQKTAVLNILNKTSLKAPYIVFGPPGTGKTLTIVEAVLQINHYHPNRNILICASSNAACDMLTQKILQGLKTLMAKAQVLRLYAFLHDISTIPKEVLPYTNVKGCEVTKVKYEAVRNYKIVIMTLIHCGKYRKSFTPDVVVIDEAAQAKESEALIGASMIHENSQLILAGDPEQLNSICTSKVAVKYGLEISLLERLMNTNPLYKNFDEKFITMLKLNYRSHEEILKIPNRLFYKSELKAVSEIPRFDLISRTAIYPKAFLSKEEYPGRPVEFCAISSKEQREGKSPSFFNSAEVAAVEKYVRTLLSLEYIDVKESDIGVITPYQRQVYKIKESLKDYPDVEIGTTEVFQGREKRIVIISTVRAQHSLLLHDRMYNLGFVANKKRFNVAVTRAISKLVIVGNPPVLGTSEYWLQLIEYCEENKSYYGSPYIRRTPDVIDNIIDRYKNLNATDVTA